MHDKHILVGMVMTPDSPSPRAAKNGTRRASYDSVTNSAAFNKRSSLDSVQSFNDEAGVRSLKSTPGRGSIDGTGSGAWAVNVQEIPDSREEEYEDEDSKPRPNIFKRLSKMTKSAEAKDVEGQIRGLTVFQQCQAVGRSELARRAQHPANTVTFNTLIGVAISVNAFLIGLETDHGHGDKLEDRMVWFFAECIFAIVFTAEMFVRQHMDGWGYFLDPWNLLDYHLVVLSFVDICMSVLVKESGNMKILTAFRIIRMLRLVRNIRLLRMFREIWILVRGMYDVLPTLGWIAILLALATYCGSVYIVMGVGKDPHTHEHWIHSKQYIGNIMKGMYSIFQVITYDDWAQDIVRPLTALRGDMVFLFFVIQIFCSFGILNVIVGVIVERTLCVAQENEEVVAKKIIECENDLIVSMAQEFIKADTSGDDQLSQEEFHEAIHMESFKAKLALLEIPLHEVEEIFYILDTDHSGSISCEEFINGLRRIKGQAQGKDLVMLCSLINRLTRRTDKLSTRAHRLIRNADEVMKRLDGMWRQTEHELQKRQESHERAGELSQRAEDKQKILDKLDRHTSLKFPRLGSPPPVIQ